MNWAKWVRSVVRMLSYPSCNTLALLLVFDDHLGQLPSQGWTHSDISERCPLRLSENRTTTASLWIPVSTTPFFSGTNSKGCPYFEHNSAPYYIFFPIGLSSLVRNSTDELHPLFLLLRLQESQGKYHGFSQAGTVSTLLSPDLQISSRIPLRAPLSTTDLHTLICSHLHHSQKEVQACKAMVHLWLGQHRGCWALLPATGGRWVSDTGDGEKEHLAVT